MINLQDGPALGTYQVKRAPVFLRAVINGQTGEKDVLDQFEDVPKAEEEIHIYQRQGEAGTVHLKMARGRGSGWYATAVYKHLPDISGEEMREQSRWRQWCSEHEPGKDRERGA